MKKEALLLFLIFFILPSIAMALPSPDEGDLVFDISRTIDARSNFNPGRAIIEINGNEEGRGVYFAIESTGLMNVHIINSTARSAILTGDTWSSVNGLDFIQRIEVVYQFLTPYEDSFYILIQNIDDDSIDVNGWYAIETSGPEITVNDNSDEYVVNKGENLVLNMTFIDRFNIVKVDVYDGPYILEEYVLDNPSTVFTWSYNLQTNYMDVGTEYIIIHGTNECGSISSYHITLKIVIDDNTNSNTNQTNTSETFNLLQFMTDYWWLYAPIIIVVAIGLMIYKEHRRKKRLIKLYGSEDKIPKWLK